MMRHEYYTPRPPVFEVVAFPNPLAEDRTDIKAFQEWGRFESIKKRPYERVWDIKGKGYNNDTYGVKPGDKFYSPVNEQYESARPFHPYHADKMQELFGPDYVYTTEYGGDE